MLRKQYIPAPSTPLRPLTRLDGYFPVELAPKTKPGHVPLLWRWTASCEVQRSRPLDGRQLRK